MRPESWTRVWSLRCSLRDAATEAVECLMEGPLRRVSRILASPVYSRHDATVHEFPLKTFEAHHSILLYVQLLSPSPLKLPTSLEIILLYPQILGSILHHICIIGDELVNLMRELLELPPVLGLVV